MASSKWCVFTIIFTTAVAANIPRPNFKIFDLAKVFPANTSVQLLIKGDVKAQEAILNDYIDQLLVGFNSYVSEEGLDPTTLPDAGGDFNVLILSGEVSLKNGSLHGLGTLERNGDATVWYEFPNVKIRLPLTFKELGFNYDYKLQLLGLGPAGLLKGSIDGCRFEIELELDMTTLLAKYEDFNLISMGSFSLTMEGGLLDWILNIVVNVIVGLIRPIIQLVIQSFIDGSLGDILVTYNGIVEDILGSPMS